MAKLIISVLFAAYGTCVAIHAPLVRSQDKGRSAVEAFTFEADGSVAASQPEQGRDKKSDGHVNYEISKDAILKSQQEVTLSHSVHGKDEKNEEVNAGASVASTNASVADRVNLHAGGQSHETSGDGDNPMADVVATTTEALASEVKAQAEELAAHAKFVVEDLAANGKVEVEELKAEVAEAANQAIEACVEVATVEINRLKVLAQDSIEAVFLHGQQAVKVVLEAGYDELHEGAEECKAAVQDWATALQDLGKKCLSAGNKQSKCTEGCKFDSKKLFFKCRPDPDKKKELADECKSVIKQHVGEGLAVVNQTAHEQVQIVVASAKTNVTMFMNEVNTSINTFKTAVQEEVANLTSSVIDMINNTVQEFISLAKASSHDLTHSATEAAGDVNQAAQDDSNALNKEADEENDMIQEEGDQIAPDF
jgi:hypothetical protein